MTLLYCGDDQKTSSDFNVFNPRFTSAAWDEPVDSNPDSQVTTSVFNLFDANSTADCVTLVLGSMYRPKVRTAPGIT